MKLMRFLAPAVTIAALGLTCCAPQEPDAASATVGSPSAAANSLSAGTNDLPVVDANGNLVPHSTVEDTTELAKPKADPVDQAVTDGNKCFAEMKDLIERLKKQAGIQIYAKDARRKAAKFKWSRLNKTEINQRREQLAKLVEDIRRVETIANRKGIQYTNWRIPGGLKLVKGNSSAYADSLEKYLKSKRAKLSSHSFGPKTRRRGV